MDEPVDSLLDPRIYRELDKLNKASEDINSLEVDLDNARATFRHVMNDSVLQLDAMAKKLGSCVEKARPYYEARKRALEAQVCTQNAAMKFEKACSQLVAAKEMVNLAEQGYFKMGQKFDPAWQEMLNHSTIKVNDAEKERLECEVSHRMTMYVFNEAEQNVRRMQKECKRSISRSKPYFELKAKFNQMMEDQKKKIEKLELMVAEAKAFYSETLRTLECISDEIHKSREEPSRGIGTATEESSSAVKMRSRRRRVVVRPKRPGQIYHPLMDASEVIMEEVSSPEDDREAADNPDVVADGRKTTNDVTTHDGSLCLEESDKKSDVFQAAGCIPAPCDPERDAAPRAEREGGAALSNLTAKNEDSTDSLSTFLGSNVSPFKDHDVSADLASFGVENLSSRGRPARAGREGPSDPLDPDILSVDNRVVMQQTLRIEDANILSRADADELMDAKSKISEARKKMGLRARKEKISSLGSNPSVIRERPSRTPPRSESSPEPEKDSELFHRTSYSFVKQSRADDHKRDSFFNFFSSDSTTFFSQESVLKAVRAMGSSPPPASSLSELKEADAASETESLASSLNSTTLLDDEQIESLMMETGQYHRFLSQMDAQESENYRRLTLPNKLRYLKDLVNFDPLWQENGFEEYEESERREVECRAEKDGGDEYDDDGDDDDDVATGKFQEVEKAKEFELQLQSDGFFALPFDGDVGRTEVQIASSSSK